MLRAPMVGFLRHSVSPHTTITVPVMQFSRSGALPRRRPQRKQFSMDLKSGNPFWPEISNGEPIIERLQDDVVCDVVVVGAGLTGALIAHRLSAEGLKVVVLDR